MRPELNPEERSTLALIEERLRCEDPELARSFALLEPTSPSRGSPLHWPVAAYLVAGAALFLAGVFLDVASAVFGGLCSVAYGLSRSTRFRRGLRWLGEEFVASIDRI